MQIELDSLDAQFLRDEYIIAGEKVYLVHPKHLYANWTRDTLKFRSSVWTEDGFPVSLSFPKFFNWGEFTQVVSLPTTLDQNKVQLVEKMDGSTLIVSKFKGELIIRTRGTIDATECNNGEEIDLLRELYPNAFELATNTDGSSEISYLFEWVSADPDAKLVVNYEQAPDLYLTGIVKHENYQLYTQEELDEVAEKMGVKRPPVYHYDSLDELLESVERFVGVEGVCLYFNEGQNISKIKSSWYLQIHRLRMDFKGVESVINFYVELGCPNYNDGYQYLVEQVDFETAEACKGHLSSLCDAMHEINKIQQHMKEMAQRLKSTVTDPATRERKVFESYGQTNRAQMVLGFIDGQQELTKDQLKKLIYQSLV